MKIVYLHQYFQTPKEGVVGIAGTRSYEIAKLLVKFGHEVTLITSKTNPKPRSKKTWTYEKIDGINVFSYPVAYSNEMSFYPRIISFIKFAYVASAKILSLDFDIVFATSTPLTIGLPGIVGSIAKRKKMIFEVRDLWPDAALEMGILGKTPIYWLAKKFEKICYNRASHIFALSPGMKEGIIKNNIHDEKITLIPNSCDLNLFSPLIQSKIYRKKFNIEDKFVVLYFGTMGQANDIIFILNVAENLLIKKHNDIVFILHGKGKQLPALKKQVKEKKLLNVIFSKPVANKREVAKLVSESDITLTIYKNVPLLQTCSPNKFFDSLAAGKPVLTNMFGWIKDIVETNQCGIYSEADNVDAFVKNILYLKNNKKILIKMGQNARSTAERDFDRVKLTRKMNDIFCRYK